MKVLNLQCGQRHSFEGWFGSEDDFQSQFARGLVECPMCSDKTIVKMPSAPRLNLGGHTEPIKQTKQALEADTPDQSNSQPGTGLALTAETFEPGSPSPQQQAAFLKAVRHVLANTQDVGDKFANQARAMHYGDAEPRSIRGQTTQQEALELVEEGIDVMALPIPAALNTTLQ